MNKRRRIASIILAAGQGTRMGSTDKQKVCFEVDGQPAIVRALRTYSSLGIGPHIVVVGHGAEQVMVTAGAAINNTFFVFQSKRKGTGHAAKQGARLLQSLDYQGTVLVVAGDKVIEPAIIGRLITEFYDTESDLAFIVGSGSEFPTAGRVIMSENNLPLAVVEVFDIARTKLLCRLWELTADGKIMSAEDVRKMAQRLFSSKKKIATALGPLMSKITKGENIVQKDIKALTGGTYPKIHLHNDLQIDVDRANKSNTANLSVYLIRAPILFQALAELSSDNAQQEEYLTDIVAILAAKSCFKLRTVLVENSNQVLAFNSQDELNYINRYLRSQHQVSVASEPKHRMMRISQWLQTLDHDNTAKHFHRLYNDNRTVAEEKLARLKKLANLFQETYGNIEVLIARAPGRVNLMGRHIDHQGGHCNLIAIDREVFIIAAPRNDDVVRICNLDNVRFPKREFRLKETLTDQAFTDWMGYVNSERVTRQAKGDWAQYIKAAMLRLQTHFKNHALRGMNLAVSGDIPIAAGLSSSSALVVATAEAVLGLNNLNLAPNTFVDLCGEGEWFVGTRGGHADHAAMKMGKKGQVVQVGFYPFQVSKVVPFPDNHCVIICDSHGKAYKSAESRTIFNQRVACYHFGRLLFKKYFPQFSKKVDHLRDMLPQSLSLDLAQFYDLLSALPQSLSKNQLNEVLPQTETEPIFETHPLYTEDYRIREIVLYGLAECDRSIRCADMLLNDKISEFGELMTISHNGDRIVAYNSHLEVEPYQFDCSGDYFQRVRTLAASGEHEADLLLQPGSYRCSTPEIDCIVDLARQVRGVKGAQISGAGLGGCAMILVEDDTVQELTNTLRDKFYATRDLEPAMAICTPVVGSGLIELT